MAAWLAVGIFSVTFVLLAARRLGRIPLERGPVALFAGLIMVMAGVLTPAEALLSIDLATLALLLGMMLLAAVLAEGGFFELAAGLIARYAHNERRLIAATLIGSAVLSALFLNDTVALFLPPVLFLVLRWAQVPAFRTLAACAIGVNLGSLWTPVGNPQNAYLATAYGLTFLDFLVHMSPLVLLGLVTAGLLLVPGAAATPFATAPDFTRVTRRLPLVLGLLAMAFTLVMFLLAPRLGVPLWAIALTSGTMVIAMVPAMSPDRSARRVLQKVDANILMLFAGLFVLLEGARQSGITAALLDLLPLEGAGETGLVLRTVLLTFVGSNLFSNVPAVLLLDGAVQAAGVPMGAQLLAAASTLSGNTTVLASAATLIIAEQAEAHGEPFPFWRFTAIGATVTVVTLAATVPYFVWL